LRALVVSNPLFSRKAFAGLSSLSEAEKESESIAGLFPNHRVLQGENATKVRFLEEAPNYDVIVFSGHAYTNDADPTKSALIFASKPDAQTDGRLPAEAVASLRFTKTELIVLAACSTGEGRVSLSEGTESMMQAFMDAGVPPIIGSLWSVDDRVTRALLSELMTRFVSGASPEQSLRFAQMYLLHHPEVRFRTARLWSGFRVFGDGSISTIRR
jgi:CHAT domain-containing protein